MDDAVFNIIKSSFPFLVYLTLRMKRCKLKILDITCLSLKRLIIGLSEKEQIDIRIYAPKLLYFCYSGLAMPTVFINPTITPPPQIELQLTFTYLDPIDDHSVFLRMREALNIPSKFNISIERTRRYVSRVPFNVDDIRRRIPFLATNVQQLSFETFTDKSLSDDTPIYDGFIWVCHPSYVHVTVVYTGPSDRYGNQSNIISCWKLLISWMMEKKTRKEYWPDLKDVEIKHPVNDKWETLTSSWINYHEIFDPRNNCYNNRYSFSVKFKLTWCSL